MLLFVIIIFALLLSIFVYGSKQGIKIVKEKMLPKLGPRFWSLLLLCKDEQFKIFVDNNIEKIITKLWPKEQEAIIQDIYHTDAFLCGAILSCYKYYVGIHPEKKDYLTDVLDMLYINIPDLVKQKLTLSDLPDGWAAEHNW